MISLTFVRQNILYGARFMYEQSVHFFQGFCKKTQCCARIFHPIENNRVLVDFIDDPRIVNTSNENAILMRWLADLQFFDARD